MDIWRFFMVTLSVASREKQLSRSKHKLNAAIFVLDKKNTFLVLISVTKLLLLENFCLIVI